MKSERELRELVEKLEQTILGYSAEGEPIKGEQLARWAFNVLLEGLNNKEMMQAFKNHWIDFQN